MKTLVASATKLLLGIGYDWSIDAIVQTCNHIKAIDAELIRRRNNLRLVTSD